jgi:phosphoenolpyruvate carboxykinase (ATP)
VGLQRLDEPEHFDALWATSRPTLGGKELFVQELFGGADARHRLPVRVVTEYAWHSLFIRHLLRRPKAEELADLKPSSPSSTCPASRPIPSATARAAKP